MLDAFVVTISMFDVLQGWSKTDYFSSISRGLYLSELTKVLQLNERLDRVEKGLPAHLKEAQAVACCTPRDEAFRLQAQTTLTRQVEFSPGSPSRFS